MAEPRLSRSVGEGRLRPTPRSDSLLTLDHTIAGLVELDVNGLCLQWRNRVGGPPPAHLPRWLLIRVLAYRIQATALGDLDKATIRNIRQSKGEALYPSCGRPFEMRGPTTRDGTGLKPGALLVREWNGKLERVTVLEQGFAWNGRNYGSLSQIATAIPGTSWNGHRIFGLRPARDQRPGGKVGGPRALPDIRAEVAP